MKWLNPTVIHEMRIQAFRKALQPISEKHELENLITHTHTAWANIYK